VWIGEGCLIVAQAGIAGSAHIGNHVVLAGQCGIGGHLEVGDGAVVAARAGVTKNVKPGETVAGFPAEPLERYRRQQVRLRKLADMRQRVRELEQRLARLESASEDD
jgi:UDP-3-O-[3-hydroxymyristoyl] glucosamine N-acyltransferase